MNAELPTYKFQGLRIYQLGLGYVDSVYSLTRKLPNSDLMNLRSQLERASTSIVLNIAEGSTGQSDAEQSRFLGFSLRSLVECVACLDLIERHKYIAESELQTLRQQGHQLFV